MVDGSVKEKESEEVSVLVTKLMDDKIMLEKEKAALLVEKVKAEEQKMEMELEMAVKLHEMELLMVDKLQAMEDEKKSQQKIISKMKNMKTEVQKDLFVWVLVGSNIALLSVLAMFVALKM